MANKLPLIETACRECIHYLQDVFQNVLVCLVYLVPAHVQPTFSYKFNFEHNQTPIENLPNKLLVQIVLNWFVLFDYVRLCFVDWLRLILSVSIDCFCLILLDIASYIKQIAIYHSYIPWNDFRIFPSVLDYILWFHTINTKPGSYQAALIKIFDSRHFTLKMGLLVGQSVKKNSLLYLPAGSLRNRNFVTGRRDKFSYQ